MDGATDEGNEGDLQGEHEGERGSWGARTELACMFGVCRARGGVGD